MWSFKKCPRCQGDTFIDEDVNNCYEICLQCGYERELARVSVLRNRSEIEKAKAKVF
jgi:hypothetical protein